MGMTDDRGPSLGPYNLSEETIRMAQRIAQQTTHSTAEVLEEISDRLARGNDYPWLADTADPMADLRKDIVERISKEAANDCLYFNLHSNEQVVMTYRIVAPEDDPDVVILFVRAMGPRFPEIIGNTLRISIYTMQMLYAADSVLKAQIKKLVERTGAYVAEKERRYEKAEQRPGSKVVCFKSPSHDR
jgi:hypothetical protein